MNSSNQFPPVPVFIKALTGKKNYKAESLKKIHTRQSKNYAIMWNGLEQINKSTWGFRLGQKLNYCEKP
jgi:hypothetical protein